MKHPGCWIYTKPDFEKFDFKRTPKRVIFEGRKNIFRQVKKNYLYCIII